MKMPDQHWFFFKNFESSDYDEVMIAAHGLGAKSRDDVWINSTASGCLDNGDRLIVKFTIRSSGEQFVANFRETADWFMSGAQQRKLYLVQKSSCPVLDREVRL